MNPQQSSMHSVEEACQRYYWRQLPLDNRTGTEIFARLFQPQTDETGYKSIATLLESPYPLPPDALPEQAQSMARFSICAGAPRLVAGKPQLWTPPVGEIVSLLEQMQQVVWQQASSLDVPDDDLPFVGGWLGWLGYDFAWETERLPWLKDDALPFPVAFWYEPAAFAVLDHLKQRLWLAAESTAAIARLSTKLISEEPEETPAISKTPHSANNATCGDESQLADKSASIYKEDSQSNPSSSSSFQRAPKAWTTHSLKFETSQAEFEQAVRKAKAHIRAGDVFQVNHSLRFQAQTTMPGWEVYKALHRINPSPFASYWQTPWGSVVSCSPERLVHLQRPAAQSRPIAGTRPRGKTVVQETAIVHELANDAKERAEHIMLVDLERNDLGRVCDWGSVQVDELMTIERYSHVMHLVSNVVGTLPADTSVAQLVKALFPGGTITGCPKVRCMEIIEELEPVRRSLFYGSCGYFDRRGRLDLNILIRTLLLSPPGEDDLIASQKVWGQVGAGIVADSQPEKEWFESLQKSKAQLLALGL